MDSEEFLVFEAMEVDENDDDDFRKELEEINQEYKEKEKVDSKDQTLKDTKKSNDCRNTTETCRENICLADGNINTSTSKNFDKDDKNFENSKMSNNSKNSDRLYEKTNYHKLFKPLEVDKSMDKLIVGREIAYRLSEPKIGLIQHVVRVLGIEMTKEIFDETKRLVKRGGLKTDKGTRNRTTGGVFLYLLRLRYASKEQCKEIFREEEKIKKKFRQKTRKRAAKQTHEQMKKLMNKN